LNFTDALALLRRMDHSTLHDWVITHPSPCSFHSYDHSTIHDWVIAYFFLCSLHSYTPPSPTLAQTTYAFPTFCLWMVQKSKKPKK
jgi:hypothetical protein